MTTLRSFRLVLPLAAAVIALGLSGCGATMDSGGGAKTPQASSDRTAETVDAIERVAVPDVVGQSRDDAWAAIEGADLDPWAETDGTEVTGQDPVAGARVDPGTRVHLTLGDPEPAGTRDDPFPAGSTLTASLAAGGSVNLQLGPATWDAGAAIAAENMFNDPAPAGSTYVLVPVTMTNVDSPEGQSTFLVDVIYVAPDGRSFEEEYGVVAPNELSHVADLYSGGVGSGNLVFTIPADAQGGVWGVSYGFADPVFVVAS